MDQSADERLRRDRSAGERLQRDRSAGERLWSDRPTGERRCRAGVADRFRYAGIADLSIEPEQAPPALLLKPEQTQADQ